MGDASFWRFAAVAMVVIATAYPVSAQERGADLRLSSERASGEYILGEPVRVILGHAEIGDAELDAGGSIVRGHRGDAHPG